MSASAEEVAGLASVDLQTPPSWRDSENPEEDMEWAQAQGKERAAGERSTPPKMHKASPEVTLSNRFAVLADVLERYVPPEESPDKDLGVALSMVSLDWDPEDFGEPYDEDVCFPPGDQGKGDRVGNKRVCWCDINCYF